MSETRTLTLSDFLLARIAEDETVARAATTGPWRHDPTRWNSVDHEESVFAGRDGWLAICVASTGPESGQSMADATHIARHDPVRVLAECEARRRIVEHCEPDLLTLSPGDDYVLRLLALPYASHPDYRDDWRL